jgi:hypothetical protein
MEVEVSSQACQVLLLMQDSMRSAALGKGTN